MGKTPPSVLTIAGSDSGGGAGIQADLKTFCAHGVYGCSVLSAITAQNTLGVRAVHRVPPEVVAAQMDAVMEDIQPRAVKIGMLADAKLVSTVAAGLRRHRPQHVVLDPVMVAKSGDSLLEDSAVEALLDELVPQATVLTPNLPEAARLTGLQLAGEGGLTERREAALQLAALGPAVLLKGGHGEGEEVVDILGDGTQWWEFRHPRQATESTHGTGCTLSSAVASRLALGTGLVEAVEGGISYLQGAISAAYPMGSGHGPVNHLWALSGLGSPGRKDRK